MNGLTARERRLLALGILAGLLAAAWLLVAGPILQGFATRAQVRAQARDTLARDARLTAGFGTARLQAARVRQAADAWSIAAPSPALAAEALRERVARDVAAEAGALQALRTEPSPPGRVRLQADLRIPLIPFTRLVRRLETDRPYATVDTLSVAAAEGGSADASAPLEVRLEFTYAVR